MRNEIADLVTDCRHLIRNNFRADSARATHVREVTEQSTARNIGRGAHESLFGKRGAGKICSRHKRDDFFLELVRREATFDAGCRDSSAERFCEHEQIANARIFVRENVSKIDNAGDGESVDRLRISNRVTTDDRATDFGGFLETAAQDLGDRFCGDKILRKTHQVQRSDWPAAHREHIRESVRGGDLSVGEGVVDDWREEVHGLHESTMSIQFVNAGVIERARVHEDVSIPQSW